jgi:hypothetical protein
MAVRRQGEVNSRYVVEKSVAITDLKTITELN